MVPEWFLYLGGFSLVLLGVLQIRARPWREGDGFAQRYVNVGTFWSLLCIAVGAGLLALALGWWHLPAPPPPAHPRRYH